MKNNYFLFLFFKLCLVYVAIILKGRRRGKEWRGRGLAIGWRGRTHTEADTAQTHTQKKALIIVGASRNTSPSESSETRWGRQRSPCWIFMALQFILFLFYFSPFQYPPHQTKHNLREQRWLPAWLWLSPEIKESWMKRLACSGEIKNNVLWANKVIDGRRWAPWRLILNAVGCSSLV